MPLALTRQQRGDPLVKISLFGNFGSTNPGNEATLRAVVSRLHVLFPRSELTCICGFPENVVATHGIQAVACNVRSVRIWDSEAPRRARLRGLLPALREEVREYARASRTLEGQELLIVPGTGLLTDAWGLWGWGPYGLLRWSLMARLRGCKLVFVSVGVGPVRTRLGRLLMRSALSLANYRSYRDVASRRVAQSLGLATRRDRIYPDLVFDLSPSPVLNVERQQSEKTVVGIGLMEYGPTYSTPAAGGDIYRRYLEVLAVFVGWLLERDYDVRLLLGDADTIVIDDFRTVLRERFGPAIEGQLTDPLVGSVDDVLSQINATDVVVATRFHNVLMSFLLGKPSIAVSFHHKVSSLMDQMGLSEYCHDINAMDADVLIGQFQTLVRNAEDLKPAIARGVNEARLALDEQYELIFGSPLRAPGIDEAVFAP